MTINLYRACLHSKRYCRVRGQWMNAAGVLPLHGRDMTFCPILCTLVHVTHRGRALLEEQKKLATKTKAVISRLFGEKWLKKSLPGRDRLQHYRLQLDKPLLWNYSSQSGIECITQRTQWNCDQPQDFGLFNSMTYTYNYPFLKERFPESSKCDFDATLQCPPRCTGWL